jgi:hypothetical protein
VLSLTVRTNAHQLAQRHMQRAQAAIPALERVAQEWQDRFERESKRTLRSQVYAVPVPRGKNGRPRWKRSRELLNSETARADGMDVVMENTAPHAPARNALGTPEGRPIRSPGIKSVQWQRDTRTKLWPRLLGARREAVFRMLKQA